MPKFDYRAAKASGATDEQIAKYLDEKNRAGAGLYIDRADLADSAAATPSQPQLIKTPTFLERLRNRAVAGLPTGGGFAGGLSGAGVGAAVGGPPGAVIGGIAGAFGGGFTGKGMQQKLTHQPFDTKEQALAGIDQAALEAAGQGLGAVASAAAKPLMGHALGNVSALAKRFSRPGKVLTPEMISQTFREDGIPVTQAGVAKVMASNAAARTARSGIFAQTSGTVGVGALSKRVIAQSEKLLGRPMTQAEKSALRAKVEAEANRMLEEGTHGVVPKNPASPAQPASKVLNQFGSPAIPAKAAQSAPTRYSATELEQIKEVAAKHARGAYGAALDAKSVAADPVLSEQIASGARSVLSKIKGVPELNHQIRRTMIQEQALSQALRRGNNEGGLAHVIPNALSTMAGGAVGFGVSHNPVGMAVGAGIGHAATSRGAQSNLSLLLESRQLQRLARQSPRTLMELLNQAQYQDTTQGGGY